VFSLPYSHYSLIARSEALRRYFVEGCSLEAAAPPVKDPHRVADSSTLRRWFQVLDSSQPPFSFLRRRRAAAGLGTGTLKLQYWQREGSRVPRNVFEGGFPGFRPVSKHRHPETLDPYRDISAVAGAVFRTNSMIAPRTTTPAATNHSTVVSRTFLLGLTRYFCFEARSFPEFTGRQPFVREPSLRPIYESAAPSQALFWSGGVRQAPV
jgi:hypothetical protein